MKISGSQVAAARELLKITQGELAKSVDLSLTTISNFETGKAEPYRASLEKIQAELQRRGIDFINGEGPGVRLNLARAAEFARISKGSDS